MYRNDVKFYQKNPKLCGEDIGLTEQQTLEKYEILFVQAQ